MTQQIRLLMIFSQSADGQRNRRSVYAFAKLLIYECENSHVLFALQKVAQH